MLDPDERAANPAGLPGVVARGEGIGGTDKICAPHPDGLTALEYSATLGRTFDEHLSGGEVYYYPTDELGGCLAPPPPAITQTVCAPDPAQRRAGSSYEDAVWAKVQAARGANARRHWSYRPVGEIPDFDANDGGAPIPPPVRHRRFADWAIRTGGYNLQMHEAKCYSSVGRAERIARLISRGRSPARAGIEAIMLEAGFLWQLADYVAKASGVVRAIGASEGVFDKDDPRLFDGPADFRGMPTSITYHFCRSPPPWAIDPLANYLPTSVLDYYHRGQRVQTGMPEGSVLGSACRVCAVDDDFPGNGRIENCNPYPEDVCPELGGTFEVDAPLCDSAALAIIIGGPDATACWDPTREYVDFESESQSLLLQRCASEFYDLCGGSE